MHYHQVEKGVFLARPNRFIAHVELGGELVVCHVKNTGRCRELHIDLTFVLFPPLTHVNHRFINA